MSNKYFAGMPSINIPRSKWSDDYNVTSSFKHGYLVPVDAIPILPGDGMAYQLKDITRMQTPIAPIFGNIKQHFAAFFVPMRLVWEHAEEFFGANKTSAGYQTTTYEMPYGKFDNVLAGSLSHYLGKPIISSSGGEVDVDGHGYYLANILKERCYYLIWNEYFRAQQITNPVIINISDSIGSNFVGNKIGTFGGVQIHPGSASSSLMRVAKQFDYFTASTLSPQYGAAVTLPLGTTAPLKMTTGTHPTKIYEPDGSNHTDTGTGLVAYSGLGPTSFLSLNNSDHDDLRIDLNGGMVADLSTATAAKINDIRYAFAVQKYLERSNFAGNYFFGILQVHYGVTSPDSRLQRPEFLGQFTEDILVHQVVATADTTNGTPAVKTSVGNTGAMSVTASGAVNLFNKAFVEPGFVLILRWCRHRQVYSQGVMREDFKKDRFEIYTPELCNLGDQATLTRELYWKAGETEVFGYQEHWAEYRYRPDRVTGYLDPNVTGSYDFWTLANKFTSKPQLDDDFILEGRANLDRALTTGSAMDEYVADTWANIIWTREMPVRTIPGLIDHFGAM